MLCGVVAACLLFSFFFLCYHAQQSLEHLRSNELILTVGKSRTVEAFLKVFLQIRCIRPYTLTFTPPKQLPPPSYTPSLTTVYSSQAWSVRFE